MRYVFDDGGRAAAGFLGLTGDCVTRAIAIATERPYAEIYALVNSHAQRERPNARAGRMRGRRSSARTGVFKSTERKVLAELGWRYVPTMGIGTGCKIHLKDGELPMGRLVVQVSKHLCAVIDGVLHDTDDVSRDGTRCVYGYYVKGEVNGV